jgi:hypothetical protein
MRARRYFGLHHFRLDNALCSVNVVASLAQLWLWLSRMALTHQGLLILLRGWLVLSMRFF